MGKITGYTTKPGSAEILLESRATSKFSTSKLKKFGLNGITNATRNRNAALAKLTADAPTASADAIGALYADADTDDQEAE